jgi:hypothetical protein
MAIHSFYAEFDNFRFIYRDIFYQEKTMKLNVRVCVSIYTQYVECYESGGKYYGSRRKSGPRKA